MKFLIFDFFWIGDIFLFSIKRGFDSQAIYFYQLYIAFYSYPPFSARYGRGGGGMADVNFW